MRVPTAEQSLCAITVHQECRCKCWSRASTGLCAVECKIFEIKNIGTSNPKYFAENWLPLKTALNHSLARLTEESLCASAGVRQPTNRKDFDFGSHLQLSSAVEMQSFCASERF
jgi:hypothetical protein